MTTQQHGDIDAPKARDGHPLPRLDASGNNVEGGRLDAPGSDVCPGRLDASGNNIAPQLDVRSPN